MSVAEKAAALIANSASAEPAPDAAASAPPSGEKASGAGSAPAEGKSPAVPSAADATPGSSAGAPTPPTEQQTKHALLEEKLAKVRAENADRRAAARGARTAAEAERDRAAAKADREAAAKERTDLSKALREGTFLDTIKALGKDPRQAFEQMQREAVKAGTPEAQLAKMQELYDQQIGELRTKLDAAEKAREDDRKKADEAETMRAFTSDFRETVKDAAFTELRVEYGDDRLFAQANALRQNPPQLFESAKALGVRLTDPQKGFTMREILSVLEAARGEHDRGRSTRRTALTASSPAPPAQPQAGSEKPKAAAASAKRNAGTTIGNDLASARASGGKETVKGNSARARVSARARKLYGT